MSKIKEFYLKFPVFNVMHEFFVVVDTRTNEITIAEHLYSESCVMWSCELMEIIWLELEKKGVKRA